MPRFLNNISELQQDDAETLAILRAAGAVRLDDLTGRMGPLGTLVPTPKNGQGALTADILATAQDLRPSSLFCRLPLPHLVALHFILVDLFDPVRIGRAAPTLPRAALPRVLAGPIANRASGTLALGSVYGGDGLQGAHAWRIARSVRSPWDDARFWSQSDFPEPSVPNDLLRLHRVTAGDGAPLDEWYFYTLAPHLRSHYFRNGELRLERAIVPNARTEHHFLLSQFHAAVTSFHNRTVETIKAAKRLFEPETVFQRARDHVRYALRIMLRSDLLPRLVAPDCLDWSLRRNAPVYSREKTRCVGEEFVPVEAMLILATLIGHFLPHRMVDLTASHPKQNDMTLWDPSAVAADDGLPRTLFANPHAPSHLASNSQVDWNEAQQLIVNVKQVTHGDRTDLSLRPGVSDFHQYFSIIPGTSGERAIQHLSDTFGLDLPTLSRKDIDQVLGRRTGRTKDGETPLILYVLIEAEVMGENGKLGPLGSILLCEGLLGPAGGDLRDDHQRSLADLLSPACKDR